MALIDERTQWLLRIRSTLYHHGLSPGAPGEISGPKGPGVPRPPPVGARCFQSASEIALRMIDMLDAQVRELERELRKIARHQAGCQALMTSSASGNSSRWSR